jgi:thioredoxin 1
MAEANKVEAMKNIAELKENGFETEVLRSSNPVLVDFYAPWCGPCKMLAPVLEELAADFAGQLKIVKVNVDDAPELAIRCGITGVPTLILFRDGQVANTLIGMPPARALRQWLEQATTAMAALA